MRSGSETASTTAATDGHPIVRPADPRKERHMTHATWPDGADMLARAGRHWGWMMAFGIISLLAGVAVLA